MNKIKCFFGFHKWEITSWVTPYKKTCIRCNKKLSHIGFNIWMVEE